MKKSGFVITTVSAYVMNYRKELYQNRILFFLICNGTVFFISSIAALCDSAFQMNQPFALCLKTIQTEQTYLSTKSYFLSAKYEN